MEEKIIKEKSALKEWIAWAKKGNWSIPGYRIVEAPKGPKLGETSTDRYMIVERPHGVTYQHSLGLVSKFFEGLLDKELWGTYCSKCSTTYLPPRAHCWKPECKVAETEWKRLPMKGEIWTFSVMLFSATAFMEQLPFVLAYVKVEGADTALPMQVKGVKPEDVYIGMELDLNFVEEPKGDLMDLYGTPHGDVKPPKDAVLQRDPRSVELLKKDLEKTYAFVLKRFGIDNRVR
ncbi:MAG: Zn-ribbon domain-containing OB-fold protein [Candidatus Bathyarchaeota archaeon]|jgi:hypothetical protein